LYYCCCAAKTVNKQGYIYASYLSDSRNGIFSIIVVIFSADILGGLNLAHA